MIFSSDSKVKLRYVQCHYQALLRCIGTQTRLSTILSKRDKLRDFLLASLDSELLPKRGSTVKGKKLLIGKQSLSLKR